MSNSTLTKKNARRKKAVSYLRVSTPKQVKREYDPEGISLPDQRRAVKYKAESLGAEIVEEFLEAGVSGKTVDKRSKFQELLEMIKSRGDIDYVIVDALSRANRNRYDDAIMMMTLRQAGVTVISATENIDETPAGQLLHGILAAVNEFRVTSDGNDVRRKMEHKARIGGTPGRAPIGYLNVKEKFEGREVATVIIDDQRGPLVKLAFELYATGTHTLDSLQEAMADAGLCPLPHGQRPVTTISRSQLGKMLRDRYYIGYVTFRGIEYQGRHPHLIPPELFHRVQDIINAQSGSGIRHRTHNHYLKGTLWCHRCERRLIISVAKGTYDYYMCRGRQTHQCDLPYIPVDTLEKAVITHYATINFPTEFQDTVRAQFDKELNSGIDTETQLRHTLTQRLKALSTKEDHYLDLVGDPDWPADKLRDKMQHIRTEREKILIELNTLDSHLTTGRDIFHYALALLDNPQRLYRTCTTSQRKMLNNLIFTKLKINTTGVADDELAEPFDTLIPAARHYTHHSTPPPASDTASSAPQGNHPQAARPTMIFLGLSSSKATWVRPERLELPTF